MHKTPLKIKYIISSHINYYRDTYPIIVTSLLNAGISFNDIIMVVGGVTDTVSMMGDNHLYMTNIIPVKYNSFDLTGLIYITENLNILEFTHVFLLHDTCLVGPKFGLLSQKFDSTDVIKTLRPGISMNIGLYSKYILEKNLKTILNLKFYPNTPEQLQSIKEFFVLNEDIVFKTYPEQCYKNHYVNGASDFKTIQELRLLFNHNIYHQYFNKLESSNIQRQIGYGLELDFYKFQANTGWGGKWKIGI